MKDKLFDIYVAVAAFSTIAAVIFALGVVISYFIDFLWKFSAVN